MPINGANYPSGANYGGGSGAGSIADLDAQIAEYNRAKEDYTNQFNTYQQRQGETDQYLADQYNTTDCSGVSLK